MARLYSIRSFWKLRTRADIKKKSALNFDGEGGVYDDYRKCPYRMILELTFILSPGNSAGTPNKKQYYYGDNGENGFKRFLVVGRSRAVLATRVVGEKTAAQVFETEMKYAEKPDEYWWVDIDIRRGTEMYDTNNNKISR